MFSGGKQPGVFLYARSYTRGRERLSCGDSGAPGICDFGPDDFQYLYRIAHLELAVDNCHEDYGVCDLHGAPAMEGRQYRIDQASLENRADARNNPAARVGDSSDRRA